MLTMNLEDVPIYHQDLSALKRRGEELNKDFLEEWSTGECPDVSEGGISLKGTQSGHIDADSEDDYIPNFGECFTNPVQGWMDLA